MASKGKGKSSKETKNPRNTMSYLREALGTRQDEIGSMGSSKGVASPRRRYGKPAKSGTKK